MIQLKRIFSFLWAIYGILVMALALLFYFPICWLCLLIFGKSAERPLLIFGYKVIARTVSALLLIRYDVAGKEKFVAGDCYVLLANHRSIIDIFAVEIGSVGAFKFLSKKENERIPLFGYIIKKLCIPIKRKDKASRQASMLALRNALKEGMSVFIFPEGTRNRTNEPLLEFYDGAFRLAIESQEAIMVQTLIDTEKVTNPNESWQLSPGKVKAFWDGPIATKGLMEADIPKLKEQVRNLMMERINTMK